VFKVTDKLVVRGVGCRQGCEMARWKVPSMVPPLQMMAAVVVVFSNFQTKFANTTKTAAIICSRGTMLGTFQGCCLLPQGYRCPSSHASHTGRRTVKRGCLLLHTCHTTVCWCCCTHAEAMLGVIKTHFDVVACLFVRGGGGGGGGGGVNSGITVGGLPCYQCWQP